VSAIQDISIQDVVLWRTFGTIFGTVFLISFSLNNHTEEPRARAFSTTLVCNGKAKMVANRYGIDVYQKMVMSQLPGRRSTSDFGFISTTVL
jgi:hypothetical protein